VAAGLHFASRANATLERRMRGRTRSARGSLNLLRTAARIAAFGVELARGILGTSAGHSTW